MNQISEKCFFENENIVIQLNNSHFWAGGSLTDPGKMGAFTSNCSKEGIV